MQLALIVFGLLAVLELSLYTNLGWGASRWLTGLFLPLQAINSFWILVEAPRIASVMLVFLSFYRCLNLLRIVEQRSQTDYLHRSARSASIWLITVQLLLLILSRPGQARAWLYGLSIAQLLIATVLLKTVLRQNRGTKPPSIKSHLTEAELPTLTVAIPARNETDDLNACLQSLTASDYPKLEIIVLDDSSQDSRTPDIIRSFAQSGVRFLQGEVPSAHWLAKNYAYKQLADAANGEYILFCGVDARFEPASLRRLIEVMLARHKSMLCVMPRNQPLGIVKSILLQPARYAWELFLPRRLLNRPPVLSTCWIITADMLRSNGGFDAVSRKIIPESYFARLAAKSSDSYSFIRSDAELGVKAQKSLSEQRSTVVRTRYPQLHKRLELAAFLSMAEFLVLVWPLAAVLIALLVKIWLLAAIAVLGYALVAAAYSLIVKLTYQKSMPASSGLLPVAAAYDLYLLHLSLWQYEFGTVYWKGRAINQPVMHITRAKSL